MQNTLYVGNLAWDVAASSLQELVEPHGFVMDIKLVTGNKAGQALGFAFFTMATDESAREVMKAPNGDRLHAVLIKVEAARAEGAGGHAGAGGKS